MMIVYLLHVLFFEKVMFHSGQKIERIITHEETMEMMREMEKVAEERMAAREEKMLEIKREMEENRQQRGQDQESRMQTMFGNFMQQMMAMCGSMLQVSHQPSPSMAQQPFVHPSQPLFYTPHPQSSTSHLSRPPSPYMPSPYHPQPPCHSQHSSPPLSLASQVFFSAVEVGGECERGKRKEKNAW